ncbi:MAG: hypothetical protein WCO07_01645 [bacterium]
MLGENKNLKDSSTNSAESNIAIKDNAVHIGYTKTNKLITALYMVTDIMDKEEPLRNKLRILGAGIISDMHLVQLNHTEYGASLMSEKIAEIMSFLDICLGVRMISEMNSNILKKEFFELQQSIKDFTSQKNPMWLEEFMKEDEKTGQTFLTSEKPKMSNSNSIGHSQPTRIGVQKGSTLLKALRGIGVSDKNSSFSGTKFYRPASPLTHSTTQSYDVLKGKRREEIISIIKNKLIVLPQSGGATITDIKNSAEGALVSCGEKTLQRELVSMVHDGVLKKSGEKRWSKYFI